MEQLTIEQLMSETGLSRYKVTQILTRAKVKHAKGEKWTVSRQTAERIFK